MKAGILLQILSDVIILLKNKGLITENGDFGDFGNVSADLALASDIELILKKYGLDVPGRVEKIIQILPLIGTVVQ